MPILISKYKYSYFLFYLVFLRMINDLISVLMTFGLYTLFYGVKWLYKLNLVGFLRTIIYFILRYLIKYRYQVIHKNVSIILNGSSESEIKECIRQYYKYLSNLILETIWSYTASEVELKPKVMIKNMDVFEDIYHSKKNATILLSHIGNWELLCQWAALYIPHLNIITLFTPIKNKKINEVIYNFRTRFGVELVSTKSTLELYRKQKTLHVAINLFAIDQNPGDPYHQHWTHFFGEEVPVISGADKFARSQKQDVYFLDVELIDNQYVLELKHIDYDPEKEYDITHKQMQFLEQNILKKPYIWLLSHNRFKFKKI